MYSNVYSQNPKFRIEIVNKEAIPINGTIRSDGTLPVSTKNQALNNILDGYAIFQVEQ